MNVISIEKKQIGKRNLNIKQDLFCKVFATDPQIMGNGSQCYLKVYGGAYESAKVNANKFLSDERITARINEYLSTEGFNDVNVDKQHLFIINQKKDLNVSMKGISEYNKLKKRVTNQIELVIPKPIMSWDDETDTIKKIDKSKAREMPNPTTDD